MANETQDLYKLVRGIEEDPSSVALHDRIEIELNESLTIETGIIRFKEDGIVIATNKEIRECFNLNGIKVIKEAFDWQAHERRQDSRDAVFRAVSHRIDHSHPEIVTNYDPEQLKAAIGEVADFASSNGLDEIGSSDVSIWTKQVINSLKSGQYGGDDQYQGSNDDTNSLREIKKLSGLGEEMKPWMREPEDADFDTPTYQRKQNWEQNMQDVGGGPRVRNVRDDELTETKIYVKAIDDTINQLNFKCMTINYKPTTIFENVNKITYKCTTPEASWNNKAWICKAKK